uniref:Uncharacterized protein n=1 Tax=Neogobius melanostomus TaxID=47308 RepID=A0A8C6T1J7_9GOBI
MKQVEAAIQQLHCKEIRRCHTDLGVLLAARGVLALLGLAVGEQDQAVGLGGAKVKGDGAHALGVPLGQADVGLWRLERDGVQRGHVLTLVRHLPLDLHLGVHDSSQTGQLQADVIVFVHYLLSFK